MDMHSNDVWIHDGNERRKLEGQELTDYKANIALTVAEVEAEKIRQETEAAAKAHERTALLERLGITEEEARLLLGGN